MMVRNTQWCKRTAAFAPPLIDQKLNSRSFQDAWLPRSPDLTPCYLWLWGYLNTKVHLGVVTNLNALKYNITETVRNIPSGMKRSAVENVVQQMQGVIQMNGGHIECC